MKVTEVQLYSRSALDKLVPEHETDKQLLQLLLDDALEVLEEDGLLGRKSVVSQGEWDDVGVTRLQVNVRVGGRLTRLSLPVFIGVSVEWDGERERGRVVDVCHTDEAGYTSLGSLLEDHLGVDLWPDAERP
jgi:hypothetical protein